MPPELDPLPWGNQVFTFFLIGLVLALALSGAVALWLPRLLRECFPASTMPLRLALSLLIAVGLAMFAVLAFNISSDSALSRWDMAFTQAASTSAGQFLPFLAWLTHVGDPLVLTGLCVIVFAWLLASRQPALAVGYVGIVSANGMLNRALKALFERARPFHEDGLSAIESWSFPSGHSSGSLVAYGMLAYVCTQTLSARWRAPVFMVATGVVYVVGWSRIFLNHHYASDVLAGYLSGSICLCIGIVLLEYLHHRQKRHALPAD